MHSTATLQNSTQETSSWERYSVSNILRGRPSSSSRRRLLLLAIKENLEKRAGGPWRILLLNLEEGFSNWEVPNE